MNSQQQTSISSWENPTRDYDTHKTPEHDVDALVPPHVGAVSLHMMRRGRAPHVEIQPLAVRRLDDAGEHPHLRRRLILTIQTEVGVTKTVRLTMLVSQLVCA